MRKRAAMAQHWIIDRSLLLMDEPFSALDVHTRLSMEGELLALWESADASGAAKKTVVFVTHDLEEAIALADEVIVLSAGPSARVVARHPVTLGRPRDLMELRTSPAFVDLHRALWVVLARKWSSAASAPRSRRVAEGDRAAPVAARGVRRRRSRSGRLRSAPARWPCGRRWCRLRLLDPFFVSRPTEIARRVAAWSGGGTIWRHLATTLEESLLGLLIGSALGIALGFCARPVAVAGAGLRSVHQDAQRGAAVVLAPLFLLWFGLGIWSKVALAVTLVFFVMFFSTYQGVRDADRVLIDNVRMLGASERQLVRHVLVPSALTWIFSSLQASLGFAMVGAVVGEYLGSTRGLGYVISQAEGTFDTTGVFAGMTVLAIVVVIDQRRGQRGWSDGFCDGSSERDVSTTQRTRGRRLRCRIVSLCVLGRRVSRVGVPAHDGTAVRTVRIAVGGQTQMIYLPTTLAQELGFYREEGIDVELQDFAGGAKALQALVGGSADVVSGFYDHTIQMAAEGREFVVVRHDAALSRDGDRHVAAERRHGRATIADLKGRVVGVTSAGSSSQMLLTYLLQRHGVAADAVSVTSIGTAATAVAAMEHGKVDAARHGRSVVHDGGAPQSTRPRAGRPAHGRRRQGGVRHRHVSCLRAVLDRRLGAARTATPPRGWRARSCGR